MSMVELTERKARQELEKGDGTLPAKCCTIIAWRLGPGTWELLGARSWTWWILGDLGCCEAKKIHGKIDLTVDVTRCYRLKSLLQGP